MDRKILFAGIGSLLLLLTLTFAVFVFGGPDEFRGTYYAEPYPIASEIELTKASGEKFQLSAERGNVVLLFFGYTACPDVCPTTLAELKLALEALKPADANQIKVLFVTVDPERDTTARVQEYVDHFNTSFIGLSGTETELAKIWNDYGIFREIVNGESSAGYIVNHTARVTLIDKQGNLRLSFAYDVPVEDIVHDLKIILKE